MSGPSAVSERESREVAEASRQTEWTQPSFLRELFLGTLRLDLIHPYPLAAEDRPEFARFYERMRVFLREEVDSVEIDETGEYPEPVLAELRRMGAFGMKIATEYGGLGFSPQAQSLILGRIALLPAYALLYQIVWQRALYAMAEEQIGANIGALRLTQ